MCCCAAKKNVKELFADGNRDEAETNILNLTIPPIMMEEVIFAMNKMKDGKARGEYRISMEMIRALDDFSIEVITDITNKVYYSGQIPTQMKK